MWREIAELSRPKNVVLAAITVPLGAHLALGGAWTTQALGLVALQTTSAVCFMAAGNTLNDVADLEINKTNKTHKPIPSNKINIKSTKKSTYKFTLLNITFIIIKTYLTNNPLPITTI